MIFEKLDKLKTREKLGLAVAAVCIFALLIDGLVIQPVIGKFAKMDDDIKEAEKSFLLNRSVLGMKDRVEKEYQDISARIGRGFLPAEEMDNMYREIVQSADDTRVNCPSMEPRDPEKNKAYDEYFVEIGKFEASPENLLRFLHKLRTIPGIMSVSRLRITPDKGKKLFSGSMMITKVMMPSGDEEPEMGGL